MTTDDIHSAEPLAGVLGITFTMVDPAQVVVVLPGQRRLLTSGGCVHDGALMSLAGIAAEVCAALNAAGAATTAVMSSTAFLWPVYGAARAVARPVGVGRSIVVVEVSVFDEDGRLCSRTTQVRSVPRLPPA